LFTSRRTTKTPAIEIDVSMAAQHLSQAIQFPPVSLVSVEEDRTPFLNLHGWLQQTYPAFHAVARRELINELSLL
jgi:carboxypeptidase PM20D1